MSVDTYEMAEALALLVQETEIQADAIADLNTEIEAAELSGVGPVVALLLEAEAACRNSFDQAAAAFDLFVDTLDVEVER